MPLPPLLAFAVLTGLLASLAARHELRMSPRPIVLTRGFVSYVSYACLVVVPISVYFYVFHGDWFLLYTIDVSRIPSAVALVGFVVEAALGALGFLAGALLVRNQREVVTGGLAGAVLVAGGLAVLPFADRLGRVGTHAQFHGQFGVVGYTDGALLTGALAMGGVALVGLGVLLARLWVTGRAR
ncbi:MAG: hypothetical protein KF729_01355 [Sandaracinaceae bacterium]|nr:hypothetical protein [Sandaracinaceae bacterium]